MRNAEPASWKVPCEKCPLRGKAVFRQFSETELEFVKEFKAGELSVEGGTTVLLEGTNSAHLYTVLSGWAFRYKMLPDGRRQILNFALPGDLVGSVGRRTALERTAYLLLHLFRRAEDLGLTDGDKVQFPFFQQHVADTLGMSLVHANNTLRKLSEMKVMRWKNRIFQVLSRRRLAEIAGYDLTDRPPRPFI